MRGTMELLPAVLPSGLDGLGQRLRERGANLCLARGIRVDGELRRRTLVALLEAVREARDGPGPCDLGSDGRNGRNEDRDATNLAQRSALFNRPKNPSPPSSRDA
jgi:hypothetical protein